MNVTQIFSSVYGNLKMPTEAFLQYFGGRTVEAFAGPLEARTERLFQYVLEDLLRIIANEVFNYPFLGVTEVPNINDLPPGIQGELNEKCPGFTDLYQRFMEVRNGDFDIQTKSAHYLNIEHVLWASPPLRAKRLVAVALGFAVYKSYWRTLGARAFCVALVALHFVLSLAKKLRSALVLALVLALAFFIHVCFLRTLFQN